MTAGIAMPPSCILVCMRAGNEHAIKTKNMATTLMTPGVYIEEKNAFPNSAVAVETSLPVFIGYTAKAERNSKSLLHESVRIASFAEYVELFGTGFKPQFTIAPAAAGQLKNVFLIDGKPSVLQVNPNNTFYLYNCMRLFFANGGGDCYILSVGTYGDKQDGLEIAMDDFIGSDTKPNPFDTLDKEYEPTLVVAPDIIALGEAAYAFYEQVLLHCSKVQSRFGIFDIAYQNPDQTIEEVTQAFRDKIGINFLNYGAVYYPWLRTSIVQPSEIDFENFDAAVDLEALLPEAAAKDVVRKFKVLPPDQVNDTTRRNYHQSLKSSSIVYNHLLDEVRSRLNELPPSPAMAGIYNLVDSSRGVWKAPANVSVGMVNEPMWNVSHDQQQNLNVDRMAGKSINVIRPFPGIGTLVWGARTLDGNSQDWRYINVRRTLIMLEQSLKLAARNYVFEPNDSSTWITLKGMFNNFLFNYWRLGALAGAVPDQAYDVQVGLGSTMTPNDILDGIMRISVKVAIVHPAEFIVITFQQQQQQS